MKTIFKISFFGLITIWLHSTIAYAAVFNKNLSLGMRSDEVKAVQQFLISQSLLNGSSTGYFGQQTKKAVQDFQKRNKVASTGNWNLATRQKAETLLSGKMNFVSNAKTVTQTTVATSAQSIIGLPAAIKKDITLTVSNSSGGSVFSVENYITCYSGENCRKLFSESKKVTLKAVPSPGYILKGWSEAACGASNECTINLIENTIVYSYFEVPKAEKVSGRIVSAKHPIDTCLIQLGREKCDFRFSWVSNTGLDTTIVLDDVEYYLKTLEEETSYISPSPEDIAQTNTEKASGPIYFSLGLGLHKLVLKGRKQELDNIKIEAECAPGFFWDGSKCWVKGANLLYIFKQQGVAVVSDPSGVKCGYEPENCTAGFSLGAKVTLTPKMEDGYSFQEWTGDCVGQGKICTIIMDKTKTVGIKVTGSRKISPAPINTNLQDTGKPVEGCTPKWQCNGWGACLSSKLTRECYDLNSCNSLVGKPVTAVSCTVPSWNIGDVPKKI